MIMRRELAIVLLTFCLTSILFMIRPVSSPELPYNPWTDQDDDGYIGPRDLNTLLTQFGASGEPVNKTALLYNVNDTFTELLTRIDRLNNTNIELQSRVDNLTASLMETQTKLNNLNASLLESQNTINELNATVLSLQSQIETLNYTLTTRIGTLNSTIASLYDRVSVLEADYSVTDLDLAPYAIPFASINSSALISTTETSGFVDMIDMNLTISLNRTSHLLIIFSSEAYTNDPSTRIIVRAIDGTTPVPPGEVIFTPTISYGPGNTHTHGNCAYSYDFFEPSVTAGTHTIKIQWKVNVVGAVGFADARTLTVIALPA